MSDPGRRTIAQIRQEVRAGALASRLNAQIDELNKKESANGKPYWELKLRDAADSLTLRAWSDTPAYEVCSEMAKGSPVEISGEFLHNGQFGLDARRWEIRTLRDEESAALFEGDEAQRAILEEDYNFLTRIVESLRDPRLKALCEAFLAEQGARFRRAAAARHNHHAFRGGLLRHTAQMLRSASAICTAYPQLNRDLLLTGALFHDSGKLVEMCPPEKGFDIPRELGGELLGHISIGIEIVNKLWHKLPLDDWKDLHPPSKDVRLHLLHLVAAHHGELQYGSPVEPKTPEAIALHYVDNLDARLEMIFAAFEKQPEIAPGIHERVRALNTFPVKGLARWEAPLP